MARRPRAREVAVAARVSLLHPAGRHREASAARRAMHDARRRALRHAEQTREAKEPRRFRSERSAPLGGGEAAALGGFQVGEGLRQLARRHRHDRLGGELPELLEHPLGEPADVWRQDQLVAEIVLFPSVTSML